MKATFATYSANKLLKGDLILLQTYDKSSKKSREFVVEVKEIVTDVARCNGCTIKLTGKQSYQYKGGVFCLDCLKRRKK